MLKAAATPWLAGCGLGRMATGATGGWGPFVRSLRFQAIGWVSRAMGRLPLRQSVTMPCDSISSHPVRGP